MNKYFNSAVQKYPHLSGELKEVHAAVQLPKPDRLLQILASLQILMKSEEKQDIAAICLKFALFWKKVDNALMICKFFGLQERIVLELDVEERIPVIQVNLRRTHAGVDVQDLIVDESGNFVPKNGIDKYEHSPRTFTMKTSYEDYPGHYELPEIKPIYSYKQSDLFPRFK
jgi:hypothetical protein